MLQEGVPATAFDAGFMPWHRPMAAALPPLVAQQGLLIARLISGEDDQEAFDALAPVRGGVGAVLHGCLANPPVQGPEAPR